MQQHRNVLILLMALLFSLSATQTAPTTAQSAPTIYYVSPAGSDTNSGLSEATPFRTIQHAADVTNPGDTVYIMNGDYRRLNPQRDIVTITRSGTADAWITYTALPGHRPRLVSQNWQAIAIIGAAYIIIDGLELEGNNQSIAVEDALAEQSDIENPITGGNGIAIGAAGQFTHHVIVRNCTVRYFSGGGIYTYHADYVTIEDNIVAFNGFYSPYANSGISFYQNWNSDDSTDVKMIARRNIVYGNYNYVPFAFLDPKMVTDGNGIIVDDTRNTQNDSTLGVYPGRTRIENNVIYNNGGRGVHVFYSDHVEIVNNTTYQNGQHPDISDGEITTMFSSDVQVLNNIMVANSGEPANAVIEATDVIYNYNLLYNQSGYTSVASANLLSADPMFVNPEAGDFMIMPGSPAKDAGTDELSAETDLLGILRPQGNGVDIGAYEVNAAG
ncbi:MAG: right-handed parallel beta-helix repeat-containing protein [Chloroflexota bacterium]|nr:right-handed parallel beta-helix repeat-containing protein [Chloroflexota bacterium]